MHNNLEFRKVPRLVYELRPFACLAIAFWGATYGNGSAAALGFSLLLFVCAGQLLHWRLQHRLKLQQQFFVRDW